MTNDFKFVRSERLATAPRPQRAVTGVTRFDSPSLHSKPRFYGGRCSKTVYYGVQYGLCFAFSEQLGPVPNPVRHHRSRSLFLLPASVGRVIIARLRAARCRCVLALLGWLEVHDSAYLVPFGPPELLLALLHAFRPIAAF